MSGWFLLKTFYYPRNQHAFLTSMDNPLCRVGGINHRGNGSLCISVLSAVIFRPKAKKLLCFRKYFWSPFCGNTCTVNPVGHSGDFGSRFHHFLASLRGFLLFTSGATPADFLTGSIAVCLFAVSGASWTLIWCLTIPSLERCVIMILTVSAAFNSVWWICWL